MKPILTQKIFYCILALGAITATSCKKGNSSRILVDNATIVNEGDPAADGCGWVVRINGSDSTYSPANLATAYKVDSLKVHITYQKLSKKYLCGDFVGPNLVSPGITEIQINAISKN